MTTDVYPRENSLRTPRKKNQRGSTLARAPCGAPRLNVALARLVDLKAALLAEARARGLTGRACECRNWHSARATSSVDGWASMALRSDVVEAARVSCEVFRAPPSLGRQLEARQRARYEPGAHLRADGATVRFHPARSGACRPRDERARRQAGGARRAGHALPRRRDIRSGRRRQAGPRGRRLRSAQRAVRPPGRFGAGLGAGGCVGKRRSIMTTVPAHGDLSPRARIYFFVFVVHTMNTMAGAMQLSCLLASSPSIKS
jgi:hypothetical protein